MPFEEYLPMATAVLAIGGDNYTLDYGRPLLFFRAIRVTLDYGKPMILWGASVGPFSREPEFERFAAEELKKVSLICARESLTVEYLASLHITENVRLCADPAFLLEPRQVELTGKERLISQEHCVGLNLSPLLGQYRNKPDRLSWLDLACKCVKVLLATVDMPVVLIPHVVLPGNNDYAFMKAILEQLGRLEDRVILLDSRYTASELKWIISKLRAFIGARMHSTIAALSSQVPTLSLSYSMKARGINLDIFGHTGYVIDVRELTPELLATKTVELLEKADELRRYLAKVMPNYARRARQGASYLRDMLKGKGLDPA